MWYYLPTHTQTLVKRKALSKNHLHRKSSEPIFFYLNKLIIKLIILKSINKSIIMTTDIFNYLLNYN